jgi:hypothetical protein
MPGSDAIETARKINFWAQPFCMGTDSRSRQSNQPRRLNQSNGKMPLAITAAQARG